MSNDLIFFQASLSGFLKELRGKKQKHNRVLYIYFGSPEKIPPQDIRKEIPENAFLLYIYPQADSFSGNIISPLTFFSCLEEMDDISGKVWSLIALLKMQRVHFSYQKDFTEKYSDKAAEIKEIADEALLNTYHFKSSKLIKLRCCLQNLPLILKNSNVKIPEGIPALICGAGPSIKNQIELIKRFSNGVIIIAVGRLGSRLMKAGIQPDFIVQVDPASDFEECNETIDGSILTAISNVSPAAALSFNKVIWSSGDCAPFNKFLKEAGITLPELKISRTSTVTALDFAAKLGCKKIALLGNDLCISTSGNSHMEGYMDEKLYKHELIEIKGNDSEKLLTTPEFNGLRKGLEDYLSRLKTKQVSIYNCTEKGARIKHTLRMGLEDFLNEFSAQDKKISFTVETEHDHEIIKKLSEDFSRYSALLKEGIVCSNSMIEESLKAKPDKWCFEKYEKMFEMLRNREKYLAEKPLSGNFISAINEQVEEIIFDSPFSENSGALSENIRMKERYEMLSALSSDIKGDIEYALNLDIEKLKEEKASKGSRALRSPIVFSFFRKQAISFIRKSNQEFADALEKRKFRDEDKRFDLYLHWQELPFVRIKTQNNNLLPISGNYLAMEKVSSDELDEFLKKSNFDPAKHAVVFVAPGNWLHVIEFAERYPYSDIIIVETWPELLSQIIDYSLFMHLLPEKTVITACSENLKNWREIYLRAKKKFEAEGKEILFFEHPYTWGLPEVKEILEKLGEL